LAFLIIDDKNKFKCKNYYLLAREDERLTPKTPPSIAMSKKAPWYKDSSKVKICPYPKNLNSKIINEYKRAVIPPTNHPFSFPLPPATKPPMNTAKMEIVRRIQLIEDSVKLVNFNKVAKTRLVTNAMTKIVINPYRMAFPHFFDSTFTSPSHLHEIKLLKLVLIQNIHVREK